MTWLFTQVWLWSLAAFLLGSLFTWLLFVLPLKRRLNAIVAEYAHRPPAYVTQPDDDYEPQPTALDLFEPQRAVTGFLNGDGGAPQADFPGPGRWEPFDGAWQEDHEAVVARSRSAVTELPSMHGMDGFPERSEAVAPEQAARTTEVHGPNTWFGGEQPGGQTQQSADSVVAPEEQTSPAGAYPDGESAEQAGHRVPPYVPPSDPEVTQVIPRITEDPPTNNAPMAPGEQYVIKGHFASRQFHTPDSPQYDHIVAEVWFRTVEDAVQAGFEPWNARTH